MRFLQVVDDVKNQLNSYSFKEKIEIFKTVLNCPIYEKNGIFYLSEKEYDETKISDYLKIREHWMSMHEFDKLHNYFQNTKEKDK